MLNARWANASASRVENAGACASKTVSALAPAPLWDWGTAMFCEVFVTGHKVSFHPDCGEAYLVGRNQALSAASRGSSRLHDRIDDGFPSSESKVPPDSIIDTVR